MLYAFVGHSYQTKIEDEAFSNKCKKRKRHGIHVRNEMKHSRTLHLCPKANYHLQIM